jgi:ATP-dependent Clp protease ATP-binding subunit ClpC
MFEKYTETARKVIFFARYEASQLGGEFVDTEHLLLGVLRGDPPLARRVLKDPRQIESIRKQVEKQFSQGDQTSVSGDFPLTKDSKTVMTRAAKEAELAKDQHVSTEHLFLALILEQECNASKILIANGVTAVQVKHEMTNFEPANPPEAGPVLVPAVRRAVPRTAAQYIDLTQDAGDGKLSPLIGRERELESIVRILLRRTRCNPVLIGEPGVGKDALVRGLARKIAHGDVPVSLDGRRVIAIDATALLLSAHDESLPSIATATGTILYIHGLFDLSGLCDVPGRGAGWSILEATRMLEPHLSRGGLLCIATGTAAGYRMTMEKAEALARHFEAVAVPPPDEEETVLIATGVKQQYEKFHAVTITDEAVDAAISASRWFLRHRQLPDRVIDLIDEAAASVKLRCEREPPAISEINKRRRAIVRQMEQAIVNHEFEKARLFSAEERKEREEMERLRGAFIHEPPDPVVTAQDIVETVAARANVMPEAVRNAMRINNAELIAGELTSQLRPGGRDLAEALVTHLTGCSAEEAEQLCEAIRATKSKIDRLE